MKLIGLVLGQGRNAVSRDTCRACPWNLPNVSETHWDEWGCSILGFFQEDSEQLAYHPLLPKLLRMECWQADDVLAGDMLEYENFICAGFADINSGATCRQSQAKRPNVFPDQA